MKNIKTLAFIFIAYLFIQSCGQNKAKEKDTDVLPYKNTSLTIEERVNDLVSRMTLEEKISQTLDKAPAIERLDIPQYNWWNECLHGVARSGKATVFPQAIGMAATWDKEDITKVATVISDEARAKYHRYIKQNKHGMYQGLTFWTPNINIFRDPRWGRGMETYGEDPHLTGSIAINFIKALQGNDTKYLKTIATAKHFVVHSGPESSRHHFDAITSERDFRETYLPAFRSTIVDANVESVMCAYNRYKGEACCGSSYLLNEIMRNEWGFKGYVVSDCRAIVDFWKGHHVSKNREEASALAVKSGTDLNCGSAYEGLLNAVEQKLIKEEEVDVAVKRLFIARFKLGMFDPDEMVAYASIPYSVVESEAHQAQAVETSKKSIVLLKNENNSLPLKKDLKTIAVIGPNANDEEVMYGNYNGFSTMAVTPLQGIKNKLKDTEILYALGCEHAENLPAFEVIPSTVLFTSDKKDENGLLTEYFDNTTLAGEPKKKEVSQNIDVNYWEEAPFEGLDDDDFGIRWSGVFSPTVSGKYAFGGEGFNAFKIVLDNDTIINFNGVHKPKKTYKFIDFEAGKDYKLIVEFSNNSRDAHLKLLWAKPNQKYKKEAIEIAKKSDAVVLFMGLSPRLEGEEMKVNVEGFEGGDRITLGLPAIQTDLIKSIKALGKPVVLVLLNGSAVAINWENDNIPAIVEAWYPGQAAGTAIADVLFGDYNPAGRLPVTFYKSIDQLPDFENYDMKGRTYRYFEGEPLFNFGYGLSYTSFKYSNIQTADKVKQGENITVKVDVQNTGDMDGEEVVQLYVKDVEASAPVPIRSLKGFERVFIKKGETKTITFTLTPRDLMLISNDNKNIVEPGAFEITVTGGQLKNADTNIKSNIEVTGNPLELDF